MRMCCARVLLPLSLPPSPALALAVVYVFMGWFLGGFQLLLCKEVEGWLFATVNFSLVGRPQPSDTSAPYKVIFMALLPPYGLDHALI